MKDLVVPCSGDLKSTPILKYLPDDLSNPYGFLRYRKGLPCGADDVATKPEASVTYLVQ
jgi:hypothetical protein